MTDESSTKELFARSGKVDGIIASTDPVHFCPLEDITSATSAQFVSGLQDKLMGRGRLVLPGKPFLNHGGFFTLATDILAQNLIVPG